MLDVLIKGGEVVDGTGAARVRADVGVKDGRIAAIGAIDEPAARTVDADGRVVCPGFIDIHTHFDAQVFWDGTLSPSPLHGVTTVMGGNCGFTIAPLLSRDADYMMKLLARVEGMPLEALASGVPWSWETTAQYYDSFDGRLSVNAGFLVGHSAIRRYVMGEDATARHSTPEELAQMSELLREGLRAGGMGFSSSWAETHNDANGDGVPSRHASVEELEALCRVTGEFPGTVLEFIPTARDFTVEHHEVMSRMSRAAQRSLNWNILTVSANNGPQVEQRLAAGTYAKEHGGRVIALTIPTPPHPRLSFLTGFVLDALPGWAKVMSLPVAEKIAVLADAERRRELNELAQGASGLIRGIAFWQVHTIVEGFTPETKQYEGRTVGDIAQEQGRDPFDVLCDIAIIDDLRTAFSPPAQGNSREDWDARVAVWRDDRAIIGASDAGAHLDLLATFNYAPTVLAQAVRQHGAISLEEAIMRMTDEQARLYGLVGRGRVAEGWHADLVVLDPETIEPGPVVTRNDMPEGAGRLYGECAGIDMVFANGVPIVEHGAFTDARPGTLMRSGRDSETVPV